jgi:hypothetical protein
VHDGKADGKQKVGPAEVTLDGSLNGQHFIVTRRKGLRSSELYVSLDGVDLTRQGVRETQVSSPILDHISFVLLPFTRHALL